MKGIRMRNYHLFILSFVCFVIVLMNRKLPPDYETIRTSSGTFTALLRSIPNNGTQNEPQQEHLQTVEKLITHADMIQYRMKHVALQCLSGDVNTTGLALEIAGDRERKFAYCVVPKAGCTMWQRVIQYLAGQRGPTEDLMSLSKHDIHYRANGFKREFQMTRDSDFLANSLRSITVRNPYTRLWSAYIDKLLLPDFWVTKGKMIVKMVRPNATEESKRCGHDVTFPEFITYVIKIGHDRSHINQDKHWLPASDICDPCVFKPEVIGKQESFMEDFKHTINRLGMPEILNKVLVKDVIEYEIEDEVDYNFKVNKDKCESMKQICQRMWTAFQYNGYIPPSEKFETYDQIDKVEKAYFLSAIRTVRSKFNVTGDDKRKWRKEAIRTAFAKLSKKQLDQLAELYKQDFNLFGYKSYPDFL